VTGRLDTTEITLHHGDPTKVRRSPEGEHLADQERRLEELTEQLATKELEFATLGVEFASFRGTYLARFAPLYAELDRLEAVIARHLADLVGSDGPAAPSARARSEQAEARAEASASAAERLSEAPEPQPEPTPDLKALYRQVAKAVHPDLASDDGERVRRTRVMATASEAYAAGDEQALRRILEGEAARPEAILGDDVAARLVRVIRKQAQIALRLAELELLTRSLTGDPLFVLFEQGRNAHQAGNDPLAEDEAALRTQI
jgi:hypothetical protein